MSTSYNTWLIIAAGLSAVAALLHIAIIFGGAQWYRFFGAGERMAVAATAGHWYPAVVTAGIALVLSTWSAYALSGAGIIQPLPLLKLGLSVITAIYLVRGLAIVPLLVVAREKATPFLLWSSAICCAYGIIHLLGLMQIWPSL
ncbi:hypothetical protein AAFN46_02020 [Pseudomonas sp. CAU 1711]|uniref:hypothetical protein n=1 Tax=Pseudomonas sp. CAU 1711 TaxID=3140356 RepID=UPI0032611C4F